jgi:DNA ligase (NAD+)
MNFFQRTQFSREAKYLRGVAALAATFFLVSSEGTCAVVDANATEAPSAAPSPSVAGRIKGGDETETRMARLRAEIAHHDELYYRKAAPEITDAAYDELKRTLVALEEIHPAYAGDGSPTDSLGDDRTGKFPLYRHRERMLSLEKSYSEVELRAFQARLAHQLHRDDLLFVIEPKFDGLAISVTYEKGKLVRAVTRGNGIEGDDVTANVRTIPELPLELKAVTADGRNPIPDIVELRGEIYLPLAEFERLNHEREAAGETPFSHPRNLAAGTLKLLDPREVAERKLAVVFYGWGAWEPRATQPISQRALHDQIRAWGLPGVERIAVTRTADEMWAAVQAFDRDRSSRPFPVDGAVVKLDSVSDWSKLGASDHAPRWAMAYKYAAERVETRLLAITLQVGRTGVLTPVAEFAPISLGGSIVMRATLHNRAEIARNDIRIGDFIFVEKAGEIVPAVVGVNTARRMPGSQPFVFPVNCPACESVLTAEQDAAAVRCANPDCPAQLQRRLQHFASNEAMDIEGLGPAAIASLVERGRVKSFADLYHLKPEDFAASDSGKLRTAQRTLAAIDRSRHAELWRVIYGVGISRVGLVTSRELARQFGRLDVLMEADIDDLIAANFTAATAAAVVAYFADHSNATVIADLLAAGLGHSSTLGGGAVTPRSSIFAGKAFVITGVLPHLSRAQATGEITAAGGRVVGKLTRKTYVLLAGEGSGKKRETAAALGVSVMNEAEFLGRLQSKE